MQTRNASRKTKKSVRSGNKVSPFLGPEKSPFESYAERDLDPPLIISIEPSSPSDYICTGDFATDFTCLCEMHGLYHVPYVVPRHPPEAAVGRTPKPELSIKGSAGSVFAGKKLNRKMSRKFSGGAHSCVDTNVPADAETETGSSTPLFNIQLLSPAARDRLQSLKPRVMLERKKKFQKSPKIRVGSTDLKATNSNILKIPTVWEKTRRKRSSFKEDKASHNSLDSQKTGRDSVGLRKKKEGRSSSPNLPERPKAQKHVAPVEQPPSPRPSRSEEDSHPLMEVVTRQVGSEVWLLGNRSLLSLNLSRNVIGEKGLHQLWQMLQEQVIIWNNQHQAMPGLKRLVLDKNAVAANNKLLLKIQHYMKLRDPMNKIPLLTLDKGSVPPCAIPPIQI